MFKCKPDQQSDQPPIFPHAHSLSLIAIHLSVQLSSRGKRLPTLKDFFQEFVKIKEQIQAELIRDTEGPQ